MGLVLVVKSRVLLFQHIPVHSCHNLLLLVTFCTFDCLLSVNIIISTHQASLACTAAFVRYHVSRCFYEDLLSLVNFDSFLIVCMCLFV